MTCHACGTGTTEPLIEFNQIPISGYYLDNDADDLPRYDIKLSYCDACGFVSRDKIVAPLHDYTQIDRGTAQQMPDYAEGIVQSLKDAGLSNGASVLEVGSNDGTFLDYLTERGFTNVKGIEPSKHLASVASGKGYDIAVDYCSTDNVAMLQNRHGLADAIVCRHTLEHVPDPADFMQAISQLLKPGGLCLIEVPDFEWVLSTLAVHEIWDEHISYFSEPNLQLLHARLGFKTISSQQITFRDTRNLVLLSRAPEAEKNTDTATFDALTTAAAKTAADCAKLPMIWSTYVARIATAAQSWPTPVVAIGASHIQSNYIHFAGLASIVSQMIDDDPHKAGKYVMLDRPVPVVATEAALAELAAGTVLRTAFPYPGWMDKVEAESRANGATVVAPYDTEFVGSSASGTAS